MDSPQTLPQTTDLVLIGGGHSHLTVIKQLGMRPIPGLRVTLISRDIHTPYSGMMPGLIAGHYQQQDAHIDLRKLCEYAGVRLFQGEVKDVDLQQQQVYCNSRPALRYDWLSINTGSQPAIDSIQGAKDHGIAIKPIDAFLQHWQQLVERIKAAPKARQLAIVGGGAASIEVALACQFQLQQQLGTSADAIQFTLYSSNTQLLASHNSRVRKHFSQLLEKRSIAIKLNHSITAVQACGDNKQLLFSNGSSAEVDHIIWAVHAGSPSWPQQTGLDCDEQGFIRVNRFLQSSSHPNVFAAGDIAHFIAQPLAKSGVYAVRAGHHLGENLRRSFQGRALKPYHPQQRFLSLLITGDKQAIASRGPFKIAGKWLWRWKDRIDRRFMAQYQQLAPMTAGPSNHQPANDNPMRCGGCGAKVGSSILSRVMAQIDSVGSSDIEIGLNAADDTAVINPPTGKQWLQTVDYFRAFIDDPYLLGRISSNHCLSDIYAMGGTPHSALAIATVPYASDAIIEDTLLQLMRGAVDSLNEQQTALIGGHSSEGAELGFGLSVNGIIDKQRLLTKGNLRDGQQLILTKPLGSGTLLAANMQSQAQGSWIEQALQQMLISNRNAATIIYQHQASACTDITGFGLAGHLIEMLKTRQFSAQINLSLLPVMAGAVETAGAGFLSSLHADNLRAEQSITHSSMQHHSYYPLLFDPQTAGGLLAAVPTEQAEACVQALRASDCPQAAIIGSINHQHSSPRIQLKQ